MTQHPVPVILNLFDLRSLAFQGPFRRSRSPSFGARWMLERSDGLSVKQVQHDDGVREAAA